MTILLKIRVLLLAGFISISGGITAQNITIKADNQKLVNVLKMIQGQTKYKFAYNNSMIDVNKLVSVEANNSSIESVMNKLLKETDITYTITDKLINLSPKEFNNQHKTNAPPKGREHVNGRVVDSNNDGVPGAIVLIKGKKGYVASDVNGNFSIEASIGDILISKCLGMKDSEFIVNSSDDFIKIIMQTDMVALNDVVVTGFQTLSKERATGSFSKVTSAELGKNATTSISSKIASSMNGVYVDESGNIQIRGLATLNTSDGKTDPLIVVDGFPIEGGLSSINPDEIDNITVLRDAAAASIYGIKSANGVIVVTRKNATKSKFTITGSVNYTITDMPDLSYLNFMTASEAVDYDWEAFEKGLYKQQFADKSGRYTELGKAYILQESGDNTSSQEIVKRLSSYGDMAYKQYQKELFRKSTTGQYNLSISGGNENTDYYVSGRIEDFDSMYKGKNSIKYFLNTRLNINLSKRLMFSISTTNNYNNGESNSPTSIYSYCRNGIPYEPLIVNGELNALSGKSISYKQRDLAKSLGLLSNGIEYNPINDLNSLENTSGGAYNRYQGELLYKFDMGVKLDLKYQYENGNSFSKSIYSPETYEDAYYINQYVRYDNDGTHFALNKDKSKFNKSTSEWKNHILRGVASFDKNIADKHYISALAGIELQKTTTDYASEYYGQYDKVTGFIMPDVISETSFTNWEGDKKSVLSSDFVNYNNSTAYQRYFSFFFNGGYTFNDRYNLTGSFRIDQSNIFGTDGKYRYKPMWSVGASWNMNKENFMSNVNWINNLTLRATYGLTGMIDKSTSPYIIITKDKDVVTGEFAGFENAPNRNLRWEQTKNFNLGLDYSLLNNRLSGYIEYYNKYTNNVIAPAINDPTNGFETITANTAEISNKGVDVNINSLNIDRDFKWRTTLNFSTNKNKIEKLYVNNGLNAQYFVAGSYVATQYVEGFATDQMLSYNWAGLNNEGYAQVFDKDGNIIVANKQDDLSKADLINDGRTQPPYFGNFTNTFSWKNLSLAINITYKIGYKTRAYSYRYKYQKFNVNRWKKVGDEKLTNIPAIHYGNDYSYLYATYGSQNTIDASHIRLNYMNLSYSLPNKLLANSGFKEIGFSFQVSNLGLIWRANDKGIDPDVHSLEGVMSGVRPVTTYIFGLNIKL